jgi:hypothetical protein
MGLPRPPGSPITLPAANPHSAQPSIADKDEVGGSGPPRPLPARTLSRVRSGPVGRPCSVRSAPRPSWSTAESPTSTGPPALAATGVLAVPGRAGRGGCRDSAQLHDDHRRPDPRLPDAGRRAGARSSASRADVAAARASSEQPRASGCRGRCASLKLADSGAGRTAAQDRGSVLVEAEPVGHRGRLPAAGDAQLGEDP